LLVTTFQKGNKTFALNFLTHQLCDITTQMEGAKQLKAGHRIGLSDGIGTGKSLTALLATQDVNPTQTILITAPGLATTVSWPKQLSTWLPQATFTLIKSEKELAALSQPTTRFVIISLQTFYNNTDLVSKWKNVGAIIIDEAHKIPLRKSRGFALIKGFLASGKWAATQLILVTSSTMKNKPKEVWRLYHLMFPHIFRSYYDWEQKHFAPELLNVGWNRPAKKVSGNQLINLGRFQEQYFRFFVQRPAEEFPTRIEEVQLELNSEQKTFYKQFTEDKWLEQIQSIENNSPASGFLYNQSHLSELGRLNLISLCPQVLQLPCKQKPIKLQWLEEFLEDSIEETVLIGSSSATTLRELERQGIIEKAITGDITKAEALKIADDFDQGRIKSLGMSFRLAESITLTNNRLMVALDFFCTPEEYRQWIGRSARKGQNKTVVIYNLLASETDKRLYNNLGKKDDIISEVRQRTDLDLTEQVTKKKQKL